MEACKIKNLYDLNETIAAAIFEGAEYPWEVLGKIKEFIIELGASLPEEKYEKRGENIWIAKKMCIRDRYTASLLGFTGPTLNSMDSVSDRDYVIELLSALSIIMMHLSRFSEEVITWNSNEYHFVEIDDAYSTGSSIMPQKKNPDIAELTRGKTGRVYGALMGLLTTMKGIPLAYNKDMQEDKEMAFDAIDTVKDCLTLFNGMVATMRFNKQAMEESAAHGFTNATDAADYLVGKGVPFRDAHGIIGRLVLYCLEKGVAIDALSREEFKKISPVFEEDIYEAVSLKTCVERRLTIGAPGMEAMQTVIAINKAYMEKAGELIPEE